VTVQVDVAIQVYGKPAQTAVTLLSLLRHSGGRIHRIWFVEEKRQPFSARFDRIHAHLGRRLVRYRPPLWIGARQLPARWMYRMRPVRLSLRYQRAWEMSDQPYLFITHNDVLYTGDIIGSLLTRIQGHIAAGPVGQCWNCPAWSAKVCSPETFMHYRPSYEEWTRLSTMHPGARADRYSDVIDPTRPWPLPECRVNEWSMLVDLARARPATLPLGQAVPLGASHGMDTGTQWFHDVLNAGHTVAHMDITPYALHAWASSSGGGYPALADRKEYDRGEALALDHLRSNYPEFGP